MFHLGNQFFLAHAFTVFCKAVNPVDFFLNIYKLLYQMQLVFIVLKCFITALHIVVNTLPADSQILGHFTEGIIIQNHILVDSSLMLGQELTVEIIQ